MAAVHKLPRGELAFPPGIEPPTTEKAWHAIRMGGIGASEASAVVGLNPYMSNLDLWRIKTGRKAAADISSKPCVRYGHAAEAPLRELFALDYPEYRVSYGGKYDMVFHPQHLFIRATLDGRLEEVATGRRGVYEGKTTEILRSMQMEKWSRLDPATGRHEPCLPDNYYIQVLHQLLATGWDFAVLSAQLKRMFSSEVRCETRRYTIERAEAQVQADLDYLMEEELRFWRCVETDQEPPLRLPEI